MSVGLIALLDDIAALAKAAAASLDDLATQAAKAGAKAAGVVIDDAAVTPRYVTGFSASRELPIVARIALGSLKNKLLFLLPAALALSLVLPQAIVPLLMLGGLYLCYEGAEKVYEVISPHAAHVHEAKVESIVIDAKSLEDEKIAGAIRTDFILSAEIMTIALGSIPDVGPTMQAPVLAAVGIFITAAVYGAVALIVKADDFGLMLARLSSPSPLGALARGFGRGIVRGTPYFLRALGIVGIVAMLWVGGGIILHGFEEYGYAWPSRLLHGAGEAAAHALPAVGSFAAWLVQAVGAGIVGIVIGAMVIPLMSRCVSPAWRWIKRRLRGGRAA